MTTLSSIRLTSIEDAGAGGVEVYATPSLLPTVGLTAGDQAFVTSNSRLYISNGSGWYNVALINSTPTFTSGPDATYALATDLTPTVITLVAQDSDGQVVTYSATDSGMDGIATLSQDSSVFTITPLTDSAGGNIGSFTITFQATDGIGIASALSTFSLSFGPDWASPTETILRASDAQADDNLYKTEINSDGTYAIVSTISEDGGAGDPISSAGAAYIFTRSGSTWTQQAKLTASDAQADDLFGYSGSISDDGSYAIVGAFAEDTGGASAGSAYVFTRSGSTWTQQAILRASDAQADDNFGISVDINADGSYAIIGAQGVTTAGANHGAAYIFTRSGSTWTQQQKIEASDKSNDARFGWYTRLNSDATYAVVSAYRESNFIGSCYVFTRSGSTWTQQAKLTASDASSSSNFGNQVDINDDADYIIVGAPQVDTPFNNTGQAYIFTRSGSTWTEQQILISDAQELNANFGNAVSISNDATYAAIGAYAEDASLTDAGSVYIFTRSDSTWSLTNNIRASDIQASDNFGQDVSISKDGLYVSVVSRYEDGGAGDPISNAGALYIYEAG